MPDYRFRGRKQKRGTILGVHQHWVPPEPWGSMPIRLEVASRNGDWLTLRAGRRDDGIYLYVAEHRASDRRFVGGGGAGGGVALRGRGKLQWCLSRGDDAMREYVAGQVSKDIDGVTVSLDDGSSTPGYVVACDDLPFNLFLAVPPSGRWVADVVLA